MHAVPIVGIFFDGDEAAGMGEVFKHLAVSKRCPDLGGLIVSDAVTEGEMMTSGDYGDSVDLDGSNFVYGFGDGFPWWFIV
jgi:hypothetical protein